MAEVSIIVPVYQVEKYIRQCVDSILGQTFTDFELILVDDGSTDRSGEICDEYAGMDGYEVADRIRAIDPKVLIFFLTDRTEKNDRLKGFSLKANDYLAKPFYPEELLARIEERFSMNESETIEEEVYHFGETTFSYNNNELRTRSSRVLITSRQADILRLLAKNIGNVVSKEMIQEAVWGTVSYANSLAVNVQMTYLRHALQHDVTVKIESLKKKGYVLSVISPE